MSKTKNNPMLAFAAQAPIPKSAPAPAATNPAAEPLPKGRGRPRKAGSDDLQATTLRLNTDDHSAVRMLALRDKMPMNDLIFTALKEYCERRGVYLTGNN